MRGRGPGADLLDDDRPGLEPATASREYTGDVPPQGQWTRLEVSADAAWFGNGNPLAGNAIFGVEFAQSGGDIEYADELTLTRALEGRREI